METVVGALGAVLVTDARVVVPALTTEVQEVGSEAVEVQEGSDQVVVTDTVGHHRLGQENAENSGVQVAGVVVVRDTAQADPDALLIVHEALKAVADSKLQHVFQFCI